MSTREIKERPILFSGEMVRAILDNRKTQTRRVVKWPKWSDQTDPHQIAGLVEHRGIAWYEEGRPVKRYTCPYGVPGDRLWVRESWGLVAENSGPHRLIRYRATTPTAAMGLRWRPSIHMPRWASRLTLDVVSVKVERVQEISEADAAAEGMTTPMLEVDDEVEELSQEDYDSGYFRPKSDYSLAGEFSHLWDSINAARGYGWSVNPWCWCLTFRVLR